MSDTNSSRWLYLENRKKTGTITEFELIELQQHQESLAKKRYDTCPICGGAFSFFEVRHQLKNGEAKALQCPQCECQLLYFCGDILPHQKHEVDSAIPAVQWLGVFSSWYYPIGCEPCDCGILERGYYPKQYSCCPGAIQLALEMVNDSFSRMAATKFISEHQSTFINSLRGDFFTSYDHEMLGRFRDNHASPELVRTIQSIMDDHAT